MYKSTRNIYCWQQSSYVHGEAILTVASIGPADKELIAKAIIVNVKIDIQLVLVDTGAIRS